MNQSAENGFTLIEVLVSSAIILVLASLSLTAFSVYKQEGYYSISQQMLVNSRTALEAGKIDSENFPNGTLAFIQTAAGPVQGATGQLLTPGLVVPQTFYLYVFHNPNCASDWCMVDYLFMRHCLADEYLYYARYRNGQEIKGDKITAGWDC